MSEAERPAAAYALSVVGVGIQVLAAIMMVPMGLWMWNAWSGMMSMMGARGTNFFLPLNGGSIAGWIGLSVAVIVASIIGIFWMNSSNLERVRTGSTLVLIASLLAFPTMWGLFIGSLLMFIGGILGLTWMPRASKE